MQATSKGHALLDVAVDIAFSDGGKQSRKLFESESAIFRRVNIQCRMNRRACILTIPVDQIFRFLQLNNNQMRSLI